MFSLRFRSKRSGLAVDAAPQASNHEIRRPWPHGWPRCVLFLHGPSPLMVGVGVVGVFTTQTMCSKRPAANGLVSRLFATVLSVLSTHIDRANMENASGSRLGGPRSGEAGAGSPRCENGVKTTTGSPHRRRKAPQHTAQHTQLRSHHRSSGVTLLVDAWTQ